MEVRRQGDKKTLSPISSPEASAGGGSPNLHSGFSFGVWGLGFEFWRVGFGVSGLGFRVWGVGFEV